MSAPHPTERRTRPWSGRGGPPPSPVMPQAAVSMQTGRHGRLCSRLLGCVTGLTVFFFLFNLQPENLQKNWLREFYQVRARRQQPT